MSRVLIDTHLLIWALDEFHRLPAEMREIIQDPNNDIVFSVVSVWEIAIKARLGRTNFAVRPEVIAVSALATGFPNSGYDGRPRRRLPTCLFIIAIRSIACWWRKP